MADLILIEQVQAYLVAQGVVRLPNTSGPVPMCWLDPRDGAPEPKAPEAVTVTLIPSLTIPGSWLEGVVLEEKIVDIMVRSKFSAPGELVQRQIRGQLEERKNIFFGTLRVEWSKQWRGIQRVTSDETSYTTVQSFRIACRVKSLAGLPYAP